MCDTQLFWIPFGYGTFFHVDCGFMYSRMTALDKQPSVRPVGVRETWTRLFDKIVLNVTGPEATMACQYDHLCGIPKAVIDGTVHGVQAIWD